MLSVKEPLVLTRLSFSPQANVERIMEKRAPSQEIKSLQSALVLPFPSTLSLKVLRGMQAGAWVTVMGEVIT